MPVEKYMKKCSVDGGEIHLRLKECIHAVDDTHIYISIE